LQIGVKRVVLPRALEKIVWFGGLVNWGASPETVSEIVSLSRGRRVLHYDE
jgi:hypothetical protein